MFVSSEQSTVAAATASKESVEPASNSLDKLPFVRRASGSTNGSLIVIVLL